MISSQLNHIWPSVPTTLIYLGAMCGVGVLTALKDTITAPQPPPIPVVINISPTKTIPLLPTKTTPAPIVLTSHDPSLAPAIALVACAVITAASALVVISKCRSPSPSPAIEHWDDEEDEEVRESEGDGSDDQDHLDSQEQEDDQDCEAEDTDDESADNPDEDSEAHDTDSESADDEEAGQEADTEANVTEGGAPPPPPDPPAATTHHSPRKPSKALLDWVFSLFAVIASTYILVKSAGALRRLVRRTCDRVLRAFVRLSPQHQLASPPPPPAPAPSPRLPPPLLKAWREERAYGQETLTSLPPRPSAQVQGPPSPPFTHPPPPTRPPLLRRSLLEILIGLAIHADVLRLPNGQLFDSLAVCLIVVAFVLPLAQILLAGPTNDRVPVDTPAPAPAQPSQDLTTSCDAGEGQEEPSEVSAKTTTTHLLLARDFVDPEVVVLAWTDDLSLPFSSSPSNSWDESPEVAALKDVAACPSPDDIIIAVEGSVSSLVDDEVGVEMPLELDTSASIGPSYPSCTSALAVEPADGAVTPAQMTPAAADWFSGQALPFSTSPPGKLEEPLRLSEETSTPLSTDADPFEIVIPFQWMDEPFPGKLDELPEDNLTFGDKQVLLSLWTDDSSLPLSGEWDESPDDDPTQVLLPVWSDDSSLPFARAWDEPFEDDAIRPLSPDGVAVVVDDVDGEQFPEGPVESDASFVVLEWQPSHTALSPGPVEDVVAPVPTSDMAELPDDYALPFSEFPWAEPEELLDDVIYTAPDLTIDMPERVADQILPSSSFLADDWEMLMGLVEESWGKGISTSGSCDSAQDNNVAVFDVDRSPQATSPPSNEHTSPISLSEDAQYESLVEETHIKHLISLPDSQWSVREGSARVAPDESDELVVLPPEDKPPTAPPSTDNDGIVRSPRPKEDGNLGLYISRTEEILAAGEVGPLADPSLEKSEGCLNFVIDLGAGHIHGIPALNVTKRGEGSLPVRMSFAHLWQPREAVEDVSRDSLDDASILVQGKEGDFEDRNFEDSFFADHPADDDNDEHSLLSLLMGKQSPIRKAQRPFAGSSEPGERESYTFLWGPPQASGPGSCSSDPLDDASMEVLGREHSEGDLSRILGLACAAFEESNGFVVLPPADGLPTAPPPMNDNIDHLPRLKEDSDPGFRVACEDIVAYPLPEIPKVCVDFLADLRSEAIPGTPARKSREHWECSPPARKSFAHLWQRREGVEDISRDSLEDPSILVQGKEDDFEDDNFEESFFADHLADDFGDERSPLSLLMGKQPHVRNTQKSSTEPGEQGSYVFPWGPQSTKDPDSCSRVSLDDASLEVMGCESSEGDLSLFFTDSSARDPADKYLSNKAAGKQDPTADRPSNPESVVDQASTPESTGLVLEEATSMDITDFLVHVPIGQSLRDVTFSLMPDADRSGDWEYLAEMHKEWEAGH